MATDISKQCQDSFDEVCSFWFQHAIDWMTMPIRLIYFPWFVILLYPLSLSEEHISSNLKTQMLLHQQSSSSMKEPEQSQNSTFHVDRVNSNASYRSTANRYFHSARPADMENVRQAGVETHRKYSSPVSPMTIKECRQPVDQPSRFELAQRPCASHQSSVEDRTDATTPIPSSSTWRPFGIFSVDLTKPIPDEVSAFVPIILRQQRLFREVGITCTSVARKFWGSHCSGISSLPPITHYSTISSYLSRHSHLSDGGYSGQGTQHNRADEQEGSLKEYILRINDFIFRRATAVAVNRDTAVTDSLTETMKLLTWTEQVKNIAESGGRGMSDNDIEEALGAARDLLCWLSDAEGLDEFDQVWDGMFVDGGLVLSDEDSATEADGEEMDSD